MEESRPNPHHQKPDLTQALNTLPHTGTNAPLLMPADVQAGNFYLRRIGSDLSRQANQQTNLLLTAALKEAERVPGLPDHYVIHESELRALLANAALTGALQAAYSIGYAATEAQELRDMVSSILGITDAPDAAASAS